MSIISVFENSEIYFGILQFGNEFSLNRMSFKRKQAHSQRANGKGKKVISESTVNTQRIRITLKLITIKKNSSRSKKSFTDVLYSTLSLKRDHSHFDVFH